MVYYFTGCGNSKFIANTVCKKLSTNEYCAELVNIEDNKIVENAELTGFVFPIYGFGLPQIAIKFIKNLPKREKEKSFLLTTPAGHEGIGILQGLLLLKGRGYNVINANNVYMPDTWLLACNAPSEEKLKQSCDKAEESIDKHIANILEEKKSISMANPISLLILGAIYILFYFLGRFQGPKTFAVNKKCNSCKLCSRICPSKIIYWKNNKPYWGWNCQQCFRCINKCPQNAIEISYIGLIVSFATAFGGFYFYRFLPTVITSKLSAFSPLPQILFWLILSFAGVWLIHLLYRFNLLPAWFTTKNRKRYNFDL